VRIIDISQTAGESTACWPGDQPFRLHWTMRLDAGDPANVAAVTMSAHHGTHLDGFRHVDATGPDAAALPLEPCLGPALVVDARGRTCLGAELLDGIDPAATPRVLFRTREVVDETRFPDDVAWIAPALAARLAGDGFLLVGTDAPSVDPADSSDLPAHHLLARGGVLCLENLVLTAVPPGHYILVALPLKLAGADSSPVRAVLLEAEP
jgi:arylformamidase